MTERQSELAANLKRLNARIAAACHVADRDPREVDLLAVTKTFPATDNAILADLGLAAFAENRAQAAATKFAEFTELRPEAKVRWSMVGQLQRNKVRSVVRWANEVQSVDSVRLVNALQRATVAALEAGERTADLDVLIQVSLDADTARGGCVAADLPVIGDAVAGAANLRFGGLMAVAPLGAEPDAAFARLAGLAESTRRAHPGAHRISAGMSGDIEAAITHGSTCVRVGTALLGGRALASPEQHQ